MSTVCIDIPITPGGPGAGVDVSTLAAKKTFVLNGISGTVAIQTSFDGVAWCTVANFSTGQSDKVLTFVASQIRIDATNGVVGEATVAAERAKTRMVTLPAPAGPDQAGAAVDVSELGTINTALISSVSQGAAAQLQISQDGTSWADVMGSFVNPESWDTALFDACWARVASRGGTVGAMQLGAQDSALSALTEPVPKFIYRPGATGADAPGGNVYTDWDEIVAAVNSVEGAILSFDARFAAVPGTIHIPAGSHNMLNVRWATENESVLNVIFDEGAFVPFLRDITGMGNSYGVDIINDSTTSPIKLGDPVEDSIIGESLLSMGQAGAGCWLKSNVGKAPLIECKQQTGNISVIALGPNTGIGSFFDSGPAVAPIVSVAAGPPLIIIHNGGGVLAPQSLTGAGTIFCSLVKEPQSGSDRWSLDHPAVTGFVGVFGAITALRHPLANVVNNAASPFTQVGEQIIPVDTNGGAVTVNLRRASEAAGMIVEIPDVGGNLLVNNLTIDAFGAETITDNAGVTAATLVVAVNFARTRLYSDGSGWIQL